MALSTRHAGGTSCLAEMREFAALDAASQRYVRCSLDVALRRGNAVALWSRNAQEAAAIMAQYRAYAALEAIRSAIPPVDEPASLATFFGPLVTLSTIDLAQGRLSGFPAYRFLYERLLGAAVRPWLASAFCAVAVSPALPPFLRRRLLQSLSEASALADSWPRADPMFLPEWIDKS